MGVKTLYVCIDIIIKVGGRIFGFRRGDRNETCRGVGLIWKYGERYILHCLIMQYVKWCLVKKNLGCFDWNCGKQTLTSLIFLW